LNAKIDLSENENDVISLETAKLTAPDIQDFQLDGKLNTECQLGKRGGSSFSL